MNLRFSPQAAKTLRDAIHLAGGVEVFASGTMKGNIVSLDIHCRETKISVPALLSRSKPGQVVIHNHPLALEGFPSRYDARQYLWRQWDWSCHC